MRPIEDRLNCPDYLSPETHTRMAALDVSRMVFTDQSGKPTTVAGVPFKMGRASANGVDRALTRMDLHRLEDDRRAYDMEGWGGGSGAYSVVVATPAGQAKAVFRYTFVRVPGAGKDGIPKPARIYNADGKLIAMMDPVTRKRRRIKA